MLAPDLDARMRQHLEEQNPGSTVEGFYNERLHYKEFFNEGIPYEGFFVLRGSKIRVMRGSTIKPEVLFNPNVGT